MKILVIAAHPDDEVYGMGGTIAKLSEAGDEVHVLFVTDGCTAQYRNDPRLPQILAQKQAPQSRGLFHIQYRPVRSTVVFPLRSAAFDS